MRVIILFMVIAGTWACQSQQKNEDLGPEAFNKAIENDADAVVIDVRTSREVAGGIIEGAIHMDINSPDFAKKASGLDKNKTYYVYCLAGGRSASAVKHFKEIGIENAVNLKGGIRDWQKSGLPVMEP